LTEDYQEGGEFEEEELDGGKITADSAPNGSKVLTAKATNKVNKRSLDGKSDSDGGTARKTPKLDENSEARAVVNSTTT
jgi:hypothetical protein